MPRLRNTTTGAVVSCSDETAAALGSEWESDDEPKKAPAKKAAAKKAPAKKAAAAPAEPSTPAADTE